jgi:bifunctional DNA-binding transcriptional regulator/antitoxin component of YhaV-PrlF toxin-antitoxin module
MKLQKQLSRKIGNTEYAKFVAVIPPEAIKELGWKDGDDLEPEVTDGKLIIKRTKS